MGAGEFKAKCLALLDDVAETGRPLLVTKRGRAVARVTSVSASERPSLKGSVLHQGDLIAPIDERWFAADE